MTNVMSERARQLRKAKGPAERRLWRKLRELNRHGFHFRQQAPIGRYIADFADHERRVIIELYGSHHGLAEQQKADQDRTRWLEKQGYRVIRFWNVQVVENIDGVMTEILSAVGFIAEPTSPPPLWGRPGGGDAEPLAAANVQANPSREFKSSPSRDPQSTTSRTPPTARSGIPPTARSGTPPTPSPSPQGGGGFSSSSVESQLEKFTSTSRASTPWSRASRTI